MRAVVATQATMTTGNLDLQLASPKKQADPRKLLFLILYGTNYYLCFLFQMSKRIMSSVILYL